MHASGGSNDGASAWVRAQVELQASGIGQQGTLPVRLVPCLTNRGRNSLVGPGQVVFKSQKPGLLGVCRSTLQERPVEVTRSSR